MLDVLFMAITIVVFIISAGFTRGCDKLAREE